MAARERVKRRVFQESSEPKPRPSRPSFKRHYEYTDDDEEGVGAQGGFKRQRTEAGSPAPEAKETGSDELDDSESSADELLEVIPGSEEAEELVLPEALRSVGSRSVGKAKQAGGLS